MVERLPQAMPDPVGIERSAVVQASDLDLPPRAAHHVE